MANFIDASKTCAVTGKQVIDQLIAEGLMLPMTDKAVVSRDEKVAKITDLFAQIIDTLGYDRTDEELQDTPQRIAKMWVDDMFVAWNHEGFPKCTSFDNKGGSFADEMVVVRDIRVVSNCCHHFVVTDITVDCAYIAGKKMIGISKINKIVQWLVRNPTSQETLGKAIARAISIVTESDDVVVKIAGIHHCVKARSTKDVTSETVTMAALGRFAQSNSDLRKEFNSVVTSPKK